jgi:hypothetical protein
MHTSLSLNNGQPSHYWLSSPSFPAAPSFIIQLDFIAVFLLFVFHFCNVLATNHDVSYPLTLEKTHVFSIFIHYIDMNTTLVQQGSNNMCASLHDISQANFVLTC